jgi:hypothetical protein
MQGLKVQFDPDQCTRLEMHSKPVINIKNSTIVPKILNSWRTFTSVQTKYRVEQAYKKNLFFSHTIYFLQTMHTCNFRPYGVISNTFTKLYKKTIAKNTHRQ